MTRIISQLLLRAAHGEYIGHMAYGQLFFPFVSALGFDMYV